MANFTTLRRLIRQYVEISIEHSWKDTYDPENIPQINEEYEYIYKLLRDYLLDMENAKRYLVDCIEERLNLLREQQQQWNRFRNGYEAGLLDALQLIKKT